MPVSHPPLLYRLPAPVAPAPRLSLLAAALGALLASAPAQAQMGGEEPGMAPAAPQLREVVISSRRSLEERFMATGSLVVVDRQDIEQLGVDSAVDVLKQLPGLQVSTGASGNVEIRIRGLESSATRVMIDGQRTAGRGQLPIDQLPADLIERIEVVRSPSAEFSGTSGGTVNIVLRQASPQRSRMFRLTDGIAWGQHTGRLWVARSGPLGERKDERLPPTWSSFSGVWLADQLMGSDQARQQFTDGTLTQDIEAENRLRRQDWWLTQRLNGRIGRDQVALRGVLSGSAGDGRYQSRTNGVTQLQTTDTQRQSWQLGGDWTRRMPLGKLETTLSGSGQDDEQRRLGGTTFSEDRQESTWQFKSKLTGARESLLWMAGIDYETRRGTGHSQTGANPVERLSSQIDRAALWGQNEWELPYKTTLTLGLRAESVHLKSAIDALSASQRLDFWQPSLHTRTPVGENAQWRLNLARVSRQPTVWDILDRSVPSQGTNSISNPDTLGNPNLRTEVTQTLDLGWEQRLAGQGQMGLTLFMRQVEDVIATQVSEQGGRWVEQRQNIGDARTVGLEADYKRPLAAQGWARAWMLTTTGTVLQSRLESGPREGQAIPGQSRYNASVSLAKPQRRNGGTFGGISLTLTGPSELYTPSGSGRERARATVDAHVGQPVGQRGFWRVGVYNLSDAPIRRNREYSSAGQQITDLSRTEFSPRIFASVGAQF